MSLCDRGLMWRHSGAIKRPHAEHGPVPFPDLFSALGHPDGSTQETDPDGNPSLAIPTPILALEASLA